MDVSCYSTCYPRLWAGVQATCGLITRAQHQLSQTHQSSQTHYRTGQLTETLHSIHTKGAPPSDRESGIVNSRRDSALRQTRSAPPAFPREVCKCNPTWRRQASALKEGTTIVQEISSPDRRTPCCATKPLYCHQGMRSISLGLLQA